MRNPRMGLANKGMNSTPIRTGCLAALALAVAACAKFDWPQTASGASATTAPPIAPATPLPPAVDPCAGPTSPPAYRIFRTTTTYSGNLGGISGGSGADNKCMIDPAYPGSGTFLALVVDGVNRRACITPNCTDSAENINWVFKKSTPYFQVDGITPVGTTNCAGVFAFPVTNGFSPTPSAYFTGLNADWTTFGACGSNDWLGTTGSTQSGTANATGITLISGAGSSCSSPTTNLVCVEQ